MQAERRLVLVGAAEQVLHQPARTDLTLVGLKRGPTAEEARDQLVPDPPPLERTARMTRPADRAMQCASQSGRIVSLAA
jgi:hypothetical protein